MSRIVTAVYRTFSAAELVRRELEQLGVSRDDIAVVPDADEPAGAGGRREHSGWMDLLCELDLPDDDTRAYQQCVRRGDYVVSVHVEDDLVDRARKIMRRPEQEAYDLEAVSVEFSNTNLIRHTVRAPDAGPRAERDSDSDRAHPHVRSYRRPDRRA